MKESEFQKRLIKDIKTMFKDCIVLKNDPGYIQGVPDLIILNKQKWAALECKRNKTSKKQPNQEHYVKTMDGMSFSRFVCPENKEEVLNELQQTFIS